MKPKPEELPVRPLVIHMIEKGCGGEGAPAWGSPCVQLQELKEEDEGVFSFFPVAEEGGLSVQRLCISQGFVWGAVEGGHTWQSCLPTGRESRGAA